MPIELHVRVSLATVHTVKDGEGKECLSRSATWYLCQPASLVKWSHELQSKCFEEALFMVGPFAWLECLRKKLAYNFRSQYAVTSKAKFFLELMLYSF